MRIATFFQPVKDNENLDLKTVVTVPDQSLSVRDILQRFTSGTIEIPDIDTGEDDDINDSINQFEDLVDAYDVIDQAKIKLSKQNNGNSANRIKAEEASDQSEQAESAEETKAD